MNTAEPAPKKAMKRSPEPSAATVDKMTRYVSKYWEKSGTVGHPDPEVTKAVVLGLAANIEECGRALCPCNFYADKQAELRDNGRHWICACDEMKKWKYCHCLLFVSPEGMPITEHLPDDH